MRLPYAFLYNENVAPYMLCIFDIDKRFKTLDENMQIIS